MTAPSEASKQAGNRDDPHTASNYRDFVTRHMRWSMRIDFAQQLIVGIVQLDMERLKGSSAKELFFDASHLDVKLVTVDGVPSKFEVGKGKFGGYLKAAVPDLDKFIVLIEYNTTDKCSAAQWLEPEQTLGKKLPFLFTQCQAIHARSLVPCQDTPSVKFTFDAAVEVPKGMVALMSAMRNEDWQPVDLGDRLKYSFSQPIPIPAYLLAISAGSLKGIQVGPRSTVWAEPELVEAAAAEFRDTESFLSTAEDIAGPYVWGIYDLLVLPPSFPYGGMENPCLTFLSPSLIAGDRSLVDVVAHEIAHSWTGNLVTNATWESFWLNEGFTMFLERRITGRLRGEEYRQFDAELGLTELRRDVLEHFGPNDPATALTPSMLNLDPDDVYSRVPYEKGHTFLFYLESIVNRSCAAGESGPFGDYLKAYLKEFAYKSVSVAEWKDYLLKYFTNYSSDKSIVERLNAVDWNGWLFGVGMPPVSPQYDQAMCSKCRCLADTWLDGSKDVSAIDKSAADYDSLAPLQKSFFLDLLYSDPRPLSQDRMKELNLRYRLSDKGNVEISLNWFLLAVRHRFRESYGQLREFLGTHGRMKYNRPLYQALVKGGQEEQTLAKEAFAEHSAFYHPIARSMIMKDLGLS